MLQYICGAYVDTQHNASLCCIIRAGKQLQLIVEVIAAAACEQCITTATTVQLFTVHALAHHAWASARTSAQPSA
jgi:hypothetical protein